MLPANCTGGDDQKLIDTLSEDRHWENPENTQYFCLTLLIYYLFELQKKGFPVSLSIGPDSVMVRASASEAGGASSNLGRVIPKTLKMVPVATLLGAQHL